MSVCLDISSTTLTSARFCRANDRLKRDLESRSSHNGGGAASKGGGSGGQTQGEMLMQMSVQRRIAAEVEFAKKKLNSAQKAAAAARGGNVDPPINSNSAEERCFDFESCAKAVAGGGVGAKVGGFGR